MSSSSEGEDIVVPVKRVKRRHPNPELNIGARKGTVNLYSHKILPKLDALAKSPVKLKVDEDEGNDCVPFKICSEPSDIISIKSTPEKQSVSDTGSPVKEIPPTPPPPFIPVKNARRGSRKAKRLLSEVSSVLSQVSSLETSTSNDCVIVEEIIDDVKEIMVKVRVRGRLQRFPMAENQTFNDIFEKLAKKEKVDKSRILVSHGDRRVFPSDTPAGVQLSIADILECVVVHRRLAPDVKDTIKIQMQGPFERRKVLFTMGKDEPLQAIMQEYADKNKVDVQSLQFLFDGEKLKPASTPNSLDLDNGDCIDVMHRP